MKTLRSLLLIVIVLTASNSYVAAQFPYNESFKNATATGLVISGSAKLTAASGIDASGQGYLRLNDNINNSVGYAYSLDSFPSNNGLTISFEFFSYKTGATLTNQADGMTFFLFDASVNAFRPGGSGGSLGYAQYYSTPGMAKGYIGVSIDEFGNYSSASDGVKNGGPGQQRGSIAVRGPGNGKSATDYVYQTGVIASDPAYNAGFLGFTQRYPDPLTANYRKIKIILTPGSTLGAAIGYKITVIMYKGGTTLTPVTLLNNVDYPFAAPAQLQFGLAGSTGSITNYHEVRNMSITPTNSSSLLAPTSADDNSIVACQGQQALLDVTANDFSNNSGGSVNKTTVDLDPATAGKQTTFTDAGKGTYTVNAAGIVAFAPLTGYSGVSSITYTVDDNYGLTSTASGITVTVSNSTGPSLELTNPAIACVPSSINITNASYKTVTTPGATYNYFNNLTDANNNTNNINATATGISASGTYYVRAELTGCATVKPIAVQINAQPSTANAGSDLTYCSSAGSQSAILLGSNPDIGTGTWSQVSGPSTAVITYSEAATSPVSSMQQGVYVYRWTISNSGCVSSTDDMQISVGIPSAAGSNQTIVNAAATVLQGNAPTPGTGLWTQLSGPAAVIAAPTSPTSALSGLIPGNTYTMAWKLTNGGCVSTSNVTIANVTVLPVKWRSFTAVLKDKTALLKWSTGDEAGNNYFTVERSADGIHFTAIGKVAGSASHAYEYVDSVRDITAAVIYYRIGQTDYSGQSSYSSIISLALPGEVSMECWPNPFSSQFNITASFEKAGLATVRIYNSSGKIVNLTWQEINPGKNTFAVRELNSLSPGLYITEIKQAGRIYRQKIMKSN